MKKRCLPLIVALLIVVSLLGGCDLLSAALSQAAPAGAASAPEATEYLPLMEPDAPELPSDAQEPVPETEPEPEPEASAPTLDERGVYTEKDDVALYLHLYGRLPDNFMTKAAARKLGWSGGGLDGYADGMCIGGDRFGNNEGLLPEKSGRSYYECDIGTLHKKSRGARRIVFSSDGLIYYTDDHYESFTLLYGEAD